VSLLVTGDEANCRIAIPELERSSLVLALPMWPLDLQNHIAGRDDVGDISAGEGIFELEAPLLGALLDELR
jgi:hypothetical protein